MCANVRAADVATDLWPSNAGEEDRPRAVATGDPNAVERVQVNNGVVAQLVLADQAHRIVVSSGINCGTGFRRLYNVDFQEITQFA